MPTISLFSGKLNRMPGLLRETRRAVLDYKEELSALRQKTLQINRDICDLEETARLVQASTQLQEEKAASLEAFRKNTEQFAEEAARVDGEAAELVRQRKEEFYGRYRCLKPGCAYRTMKPRERICFVAGTLIRTAGGFTAIEQLQAGERVLSTDPETGELLEKPVPET